MSVLTDPIEGAVTNVHLPVELPSRDDHVATNLREDRLPLRPPDPVAWAMGRHQRGAGSLEGDSEGGVGQTAGGVKCRGVQDERETWGESRGLKVNRFFSTDFDNLFC